MKFTIPIPCRSAHALPGIAAVLAVALSFGTDALAADQWLRRTPGPEAYVRNLRIFPNTPAAGQAVVYVATLTNGVVKVVDNGTTLVPTAVNNGLPIRRARAVRGADVNNLYVGLDGSGVYKSTNGGASWVAANGSGSTALGCLSVRNITLVGAAEVWAVTGCRHASGLYRTTDGGATWSRLGVGTIPDDDLGSTVDFSGTVIVYSSRRSGVFRSANNGVTWTQINNGLPAAGGPNRLSVNGTTFITGASQMLAYVEGAGVYRTSDGGATWTASGSGLPSPTYSNAQVYGESSTTFYIATDKGPVYKSIDGGLNWSVWGNTGLATGTGYVRSVTRDTTAPTRYYLAGIAGLYRTDDNGVSFSHVGLGGEGYVTSMLLDPDGAAGYFASDSLYKTPDVYAWNPNSFVDIGAGLPGTTLGGSLAQDKTQPGTLYASLLYRGVYKTTNGGTNWTQLALPNVLASAPPFVEISPSNPQVIYATPGNPFGVATGGGFFKSTNGGTSWTETSTGLATPESRDINGIGLSETAPDVIVISTEDGLYRSANGGANWAPVLQFTDELGGKLPMGSVRFHPVDPQVVYAGATHVNADGTIRASSGVWKSVNGGANWTQVLSGKRVSAVRPEASGRVIVMLNRDPSQPAVLATTDGGATWLPFNSGITYNDGMAIARTVSELGSRVVLASMTDGIYVLDKASASTNYTALWWNPAESGWGINLNHQANTIFATLFTYANDGNALWLVASNLAQQADGSFSGILYRTSGPPFNQVPWSAISFSEVGTMTLRFSSSGAGTLSYTFGGVSVSKAIERQVFSSPAPTCTLESGSRASLTNYQDLWWNPAESGWGINLTHQGNIIFATLFTYTSSGRDGWMVASNLSRQPDGSFTGPLYVTSGPPFNTQPWRPITSNEVGAMTLRFASGEAGTLNYSVSGTNVSKNIVRQVFGSTVPFCR